MDARQMACQLSCTQLHKRGNLVHRHPQVAADQDPTAFAHTDTARRRAFLNFVNKCFKSSMFCLRDGSDTRACNTSGTRL